MALRIRHDDATWAAYHPLVTRGEDMSKREALFRLIAESARAEQGEEGLALRAGELVQAVPSAEATLTNDQVVNLLHEHQELEALAVVRDGVPVGLIKRTTFMESYGKLYARELFGSRRCDTWMDQRPLVFDAETPVESLTLSALGAGSKALSDGFVVTRDGKYVGLGSGFSLMKAMSGLERAKTRQLLDSIDYASRIQRAQHWASDYELDQALPDHALLWEPRDVVGGDCYFFRRDDTGLVGAVVDCTGHGVPGAFMTLIVLAYLQDLGGAAGIHDPGAVLAGINRHVKRVLAQRGDDRAVSQGGGEERADGGLDAACFHLSRDASQLAFASARMPLIVMRPGAAPSVVEGERVSVGYSDTPDDHRWTKVEVPVVPGMRVAIASDGVIDQVGGDRRLGFGRRRLLQVLAEAQARPLPELEARFRTAFADWQGTEARRDDVTLFAATVAP
jgi:serine phosphatase RsbU (regulator of sigma subunit)